MTLVLQTLSSFLQENVSMAPDVPGLGKPPAYTTALGAAWCGDSLDLLDDMADASVNLVLTSPPFALQRQKAYGNKDQCDYVDWLLEFAAKVRRVLTEDGSLVVDLGGAYEKGFPVRSLYPFRFMIRACDELGFFLAEEVYWHNPAKLPSPIEWVNKRKLRMKDSVNTVWWFSKTEWPKADVSKVLAPYSARMTKLIENPEAFYKPKLRPSGHDIGRAFAKDNGGAIPSNLLQVPNTESNGRYLAACKLVGASQHPARFPAKIPEHFIRMLTDPGDLVLDIFAGSNTTWQIAEAEGRRWMSFEIEPGYVATSAFRFAAPAIDGPGLQTIHADIRKGHTVHLPDYVSQPSFLSELTAAATAGSVILASD
jgi:site-specific DNA-methyltransferase (cytosine-N4-specific)